MPRASTTSSAKRSSNNNHHAGGQNGLVPPKRQIRSHSPAGASTSSNNNGQQSSASEQSTASPSSGSNSTAKQQNGQLSQQATHATVNGTANGTATNSDVDEKSGGGVVEGLDAETACLPVDSHKKINMKPSNSNLNAAAMLDNANRTILPSWPLVDSLTLLIIMLQLPSTLLSLVYFLFAIISVVPTNFSFFASSSPGNISTIASLFAQGSPNGPSMYTILFTDVIMFLVSVFLWPSARVFLIDMAQAVVADTLGAGGSSTSGGSTKNVGFCALVVGISQVYKDRFRLTSSLGIELERPTTAASTPIADSSPGTLRWIFAVHIVTHGLIRATRRWLMPKSTPENASQPKDPEAAVQPITDTTKVKKGKKQGQWVRDRQPLWAAVASSIVHLKEVERTTSTLKADPKPHFLENASNDEPEVWITKIGATEIEFGSNYHPAGEDDVVQSADTRFPFYVELNGIKWPQTMISKRNGGSDEVSTLSEFFDENEWRAEIFGLTPTTEYDISFLHKNTGEVIYTTSACTSSRQANVDSFVKDVPKPTGPLNAITTLLQSLEASRNGLEEQKRKLKITKRQNTKRTATFRNEIDTAKSRLGAGDKNDERARRRALSLRDSVRRAEEDAEKFSGDLHALETLPEDPEEEYRERRREWREEKDRLTASKKSATTLLEDAERKINEVKNEVASAASKRDKASSKLTRIRTDLERIRSENAAAADEEERARKREGLVARRQGIEIEFNASISKMEMDTMHFKNQARTNYSNLRTLETSLALQQQQLQAQQDYQAMSPRSIFGTQTSPTYGQYPTKFSPPSMVPPASSNSSSFPPSMFYDHHQRSSSMFSDITNISEIDHIGQRKRSIPEEASSYVSDPFMPSFLTHSEERNPFASNVSNNNHAFANQGKLNDHSSFDLNHSQNHRLSLNHFHENKHDTFVDAEEEKHSQGSGSDASKTSSSEVSA